MYAAGMLGSYLTQGVYAVAGPFQPFGGAVDIIVVQQEDGTFKSSPWYVKFGDYQTPFKTRAREKAVDISVNDIPADFHMFLDYNGEAYFEKEIDMKDESVAPQVSEASFSSEGGRALDAVNEREGSETNDVRVHAQEILVSDSSLRSSDAEEVFVTKSSLGSPLDSLNNSSDGKKSNATQGTFAAVSADVVSEGEERLSVAPSKINGVGVSHVQEILITKSSHKLSGKISSENSTEILVSGEAHAIDDTDGTVFELFSNGDTLSLLQSHESNSTYMEVKTTYRSDSINTYDPNIESQEDQLKPHLWGDSHSNSVLGAVSINNESNNFTTVINNNRNLDTEDGTVLIDFKSTHAEPDIALAAYDFRQLVVEEREDWSVENLPKSELSTESTHESADKIQGSEGNDINVKTSVIIPVKDEASGVENSELEKQVENEEVTQQEGHRIAVASATSSYRWSLWPLSFRRSKLEKVTSSSSNHALLATTSITAECPPTEELMQNNDWPQKTRVRTYVPTSIQLASLNLKDGPNKVTFTSVLGKTEVDARIYLWKWNTRIVISDVDGTITKSDVLGQVMPLVGRDWSQYGVTRLFSAIKDNGFQVLFLSARAISQAYLTRKFLLNLKQDGEALPEGPVFISPDGLLPSLYREVIRRAPHEFKISCLEAIRELFPKDVNPFYAGFGNRITDEISYLKVGIPKGKIFIINPKGEVVVDRRVDHKSYTSLHALVDDMFPPMSSHEQEDFNSWNYWKMPLLDIDEEISGKSLKNSKKTKK